MRQVALSMLLGMVALVIVGCDRQPELSASELAHALGITAWSVQLPSDLPEDADVRLVLKHADGTETGGGGFIGPEPGQVMRVFLWNDRHEERYRYALILQSGGSMRGAMKNPFEGDSRLIKFQQRIARPGDFLMKGAEDEQISNDNALHEGEYGWTIQIDDR